MITIEPPAVQAASLVFSPAVSREAQGHTAGDNAGTGQTQK